MKYVTYNLLPDGTQPYQALASYGVTAELGQIENAGTYVGYIYGTEQQMDNGIAGCSNFNMIEKTQQEAIDFFDNALPDTMLNGDNVECSVGPAYAKEDGTITYDLTPL